MNQIECHKLLSPNFRFVVIFNYYFVSHGRTRLSHTSRYILQSKLCKTNTFQSSYYNRVVKTWNTVGAKKSHLTFSVIQTRLNTILNVDTIH